MRHRDRFMAADTPAPRKDDYPAAGRRLYQDGDHLWAERRYGSATHLFGLAAECAIKAAMKNVPPSDRKLPHEHLPELLTQARRLGWGRRYQGLLQLIAHAEYMDGWYINNRYWPDGAFDEASCTRFRDHARRTLIASGVPI